MGPVAQSVLRMKEKSMMVSTSSLQLVGTVELTSTVQLIPVSRETMLAGADAQ